MNAIALLSGWSHHRSSSSPSPSSASSRRLSISSRSHDGSGNGNSSEPATPAQQEFHDEKEVLDNLIDGENLEGRRSSGQAVPVAAGSSQQSTLVSPGEANGDLTRILKPPEAAAYEDIEESVARISPSNNEPASIYPIPSSSSRLLPTPTDAIDETAAGIQIGGEEASSSTSTIDTSNGESSSTTPPYTLTPSSRFRGKLFRRHVPPQSQSHDEQEVRTPQQRRMSDRHTRAFARSFPIRCIARIYMLLRKFFALFGIELQPATAVPTLTHATADATPSLAAPILAVQPSTPILDDAPPSYADATSIQSRPEERLQPPDGQNSQRWKIGSLLSRKRPTGSTSDTATDRESTASNTAEGYASTSSDEWSQSEEKKLLRKSESDSSSRIPSSISGLPPSSTRGHAKTASIATAAKASVAQLALSKPKLLVLDLDETLIHSTSRMSYASSAVTSSADGSGGRSGWNANTSGLKVRVVEVVLDGRSVIYHVYKRPWVDFFLRKVSSWYTVVIFTASLQEYADPVIDWLDQGTGMLSTRLFRESCTYVNGSYLKDLSIVEKDLARVCLVDNSPISYAINPANGIPIEGWINDPNDEALLDLLPMLDSLRFTNDVRHVLALRLASTTTAVSSSAAKARRRRTSTLMGGDAAEQAAAQRAVQSHSKAE